MHAVVAPINFVMIDVQVLGGFKEWPLLEDVDMAQRYAPPRGGEGVYGTLEHAEVHRPLLHGGEGDGATVHSRSLNRRKARGGQCNGDSLVLTGLALGGAAFHPRGNARFVPVPGRLNSIFFRFYLFL